MKTQSGSTSRRTIGILACVGVVGALAVAFGLKQFFNRPGEASLRYIPADAAVVISLDITPGPSQVVAFKSISDSLKSHGYDKSINDTLLQAFGGNSVYKEIRPLINGGGAAYLDGTSTKDPSKMGGFVVLSISDQTKATAALKSHGPIQYYKGIMYATNGPTVVTVIDDQLVIGSAPAELYKAKQAKDGDIPAINGVSEFQDARKDLDSDANFVCFVKMSAFSDLLRKAGPTAQMPDWAAFGLSIRDGGLEFSGATKADTSKNPQMKILASAPPLRSDLFDILPSGSYGVMAVSDFADTVRTSVDQLMKDPTIGSTVRDGESKFQKATGLSIEDDVVRATQGDGILAFYPSDVAGNKGIDMLLIEDDQNGADPASEFRKYEAYAEKELAKNSGPQLFVQKSIGGDTEYVLSDRLLENILHGFGDQAYKAIKSKDSPIGNKTIAVAVVGKSVIACSSQALLDRTVASFQSKKDNLSADPNYAPYLSTVNDGENSLAMISLSRIAMAVKVAMGSPKSGAGASNPFTGILDVIGRLKEPLTIKSKITPDGLVKASTFIPLDYAALIDAIGKAAQPRSAVPSA